jgi:hypothetical protein
MAVNRKNILPIMAVAREGSSPSRCGKEHIVIAAGRSRNGKRANRCVGLARQSRGDVLERHRHNQALAPCAGASDVFGDDTEHGIAIANHALERDCFGHAARNSTGPTRPFPPFASNRRRSAIADGRSDPYRGRRTDPRITYRRRCLGHRLRPVRYVRLSTRSHQRCVRRDPADSRGDTPLASPPNRGLTHKAHRNARSAESFRAWTGGLIRIVPPEISAEPLGGSAAMLAPAAR